MSHFLPQPEGLRHSHDVAHQFTAPLEVGEAHVLHRGTRPKLAQGTKHYKGRTSTTLISLFLSPRSRPGHRLGARFKVADPVIATPGKQMSEVRERQMQKVQLRKTDCSSGSIMMRR